MQVDYDPRQSSYERLLAVFWSTHNPCTSPGNRQYMSAIFYASAAQKKLAFQTRGREQARRGNPIATEILPLGIFTVAEDYHQKYYLRQEGSLMKEFRAMYPAAVDFMNSTAAARVNAYASGQGDAAMLRKELHQLGLSADARQTLLRMSRR